MRRGIVHLIEFGLELGFQLDHGDHASLGVSALQQQWAHL